MGLIRLQLVFASLFLSLFSLSWAISITGSRTLLLLEDENKAAYSILIKDLEARGYNPSIHSPKSDDLKLFEHEERVYDNIILFPSKLKGLGPNLLSDAFLKHAKLSGNFLVLLPSDSQGSVPTAINELAGQVDVIIPPKGFSVVDHFAPLDKDDVHHDKFFVDIPTFPDSVKNYFSGSGDPKAKILYKGAGLQLGNSALVEPILKAPRFAYSYDVQESGKYADDEGVFAAGEQLVLVAGVQTRNNARITFVAGGEIFSDAYFGKVAGVETGNRAFAKDVTAWTFKETGVLKVDSIEHWGKELGPEVVNGNIYRVKSDVTYSIALSEYSYDHWTPYTVPKNDDLQLEFIMLDPYYRLPLAVQSTNANSTIYSTTFHTPDQHGVFTFHVNYKRPFITYLHEKRAVTVRHFAHNEWTRSWGITGSWPWIAGVWVVVVGWIGFVAIWLWSAPIADGKKKVAGKKL